jgi:hypothetical protein
VLTDAFVHYLGNNAPGDASRHFYGLQEAKPDLVGVALFDRLQTQLWDGRGLRMMMWEQREIENYFTTPAVLLAYAKHDGPSTMLDSTQGMERTKIMQTTIDEVSRALVTLGKPSPWSGDIKATDDFLNPVFKQYFDRLKLPNLLNKTDYHILVQFTQPDQVPPEVIDKLDHIVNTARQANPR